MVFSEHFEKANFSKTRAKMTFEPFILSAVADFKMICNVVSNPRTLALMMAGGGSE